MNICMTERARDDLQILADHVELTLCNYLREIIISRLLGHGTLPMRPAMQVTEKMVIRNGSVQVPESFEQEIKFAEEI